MPFDSTPSEPITVTRLRNLRRIIAENWWEKNHMTWNQEIWDCRTACCRAGAYGREYPGCFGGEDFWLDPDIFSKLEDYFGLSRENSEWKYLFSPKEFVPHGAAIELIDRIIERQLVTVA